jgi:hypothetical protein
MTTIQKFKLELVIFFLVLALIAVALLVSMHLGGLPQLAPTAVEYAV